MDEAAAKLRVAMFSMPARLKEMKASWTNSRLAGRESLGSSATTKTQLNSRPTACVEEELQRMVTGWRDRSRSR
jgi:hypothetical protein